MEFEKYTIKNIKQVLGELKTSFEGLAEKEAETRLEIYGTNEIKSKEGGLKEIFFRQVKSPFIWLLLVASLTALLIGEKIDSLVIAAFILINVSLGFFQEARAQRAVALLKKYLPSRTKVIRAGMRKLIEKSKVVPGDIVFLEPGAIAPADLRVIKAKDFLVDESILTGESAPVGKIIFSLKQETKEIFEAKNIAFGGTTVISGQVVGVAIATGRQTYLGQIAKLVAGLERESIYEKNLLSFSKTILKIVVGTIVLIFLANLALKGTTNLFEFLIFTIALIVSIIPEALPLVVTFAFSSGALKLAKEKVVVKRLAAIEDLGNIEVLCVDKTGTLTENKLVLEKIYSKNDDQCLTYGLLASGYSGENPFDKTLWQSVGAEIKKNLGNYQLMAEMPFDPQRLRVSSLVKDGEGNLFLLVRGAPEIILGLSSKIAGDLTKKEILEKMVKEGQEGKRVLAVGWKKILRHNYSQKDEQNLEFLGYFTFQDPLKKTALPTIRLAKKLGLEIKVLTGDSQEVAGQVALEVGLIEEREEVVLGKKLEDLSEEDFIKVVEEKTVFARISPQLKYRIVAALQKNHEVGFLGEGINDTPALKAAQVALSVENASDVAREASDIVLLKKDLKVIVNGIKEGRQIFANINKYIKCTLTSNFGNFYSIALISLFIPFLPMLPIQILLVNLLSDFPLVAIAGDSVEVRELKKPKAYQLQNLIGLIVILALISFLFDFLFFALFYRAGASILQTLWFVESILTEIVLLFSIRTSRFFLKTKAPAWPLLLVSVLAVILAVSLPFIEFGQRAFHLVRPPLPGFLLVLGLVGSYFILSEMAKLGYFRWYYNKTNRLR